jgi:hypothetical protein
MMAALETLNISQNHLTGQLPPELGSLSNLLVLDLSQNRNNTSCTQGLAGPIPDSLGSLGRLQQLSLGVNYLSGPIPAALGQLAELVGLDLHTNRLGPIPEGLGKLAKLEWLDLGDNLLDGPLPADLGNLKQLYLFSVEATDVTGAVPFSLSPLPTDLGRLVNLRKLWVGDSQFTGALPQSLAAVPNMENLFYSRSPLCEPNDATFQAWLSHIAQYHMLSGTGVACGAAPATRSIGAAGGTLDSPADMTAHSFAPGTFAADTTVTHTPLRSDSAPPPPTATPATGMATAGAHAWTAADSAWDAAPETGRAMPAEALAAAAAQGLVGIGHVFELAATDAGGHPVTPRLAYSTSIQYSAYQSANTDEATLALYWWDGTRWNREPSSAMDPAARTVSAWPDHFSLWAVFGKAGFKVYLPLVMKPAG